jgi:hypothetical protein
MKNSSVRIKVDTFANEELNVDDIEKTDMKKALEVFEKCFMSGLRNTIRFLINYKNSLRSYLWRSNCSPSFFL